MAGKDGDSDRDGFPADVFEQMKAGHEKFMRDLQDSGRRLQQDIQSETDRSGGNFFTSFKDFVDTNLSSLKESFRSFPNNIAELKAKMQEERERRKEEELDIWRRWTGIEESPDFTEMLRDRQSLETRKEAEDAALMLLREAQKRNAHVPPEKVFALYKDNTPLGSLDRFAEPMLSPGGSCYYQRDTAYNAPSTTTWRFGMPKYRWLSVEWFKRSPYSPVRLEAQHPESEIRWRLAFEDLINAALDKPMRSFPQVGTRIPQGKPQSTLEGPGLDWMLSLQCRGILPPQLPHLYSSAKRATSVERALAYRPFDSRDIVELADEINTPAPAKGFEPYAGGTFTEIDVAEAQTMTEKQVQDYQAQLMLIEQANKQRLLEAREKTDADPPLTASSAAESWVPALTGSRDEDIVEATAALADAFEYGDLKAAMETLNEWHNTYGDLEALVKPLNEYRSEVWDYVERLEQERDALQLDSKKKPAYSSAASKPHAMAEKVDVLSSLTTTHTTRLPDGTTTTKIILKQRFADGREETHEKVHMYQDAVEQPREAVDEPKQQASGKSKGWFWS